VCELARATLICGCDCGFLINGCTQSAYLFLSFVTPFLPCGCGPHKPPIRAGGTWARHGDNCLAAHYEKIGNKRRAFTHSRKPKRRRPCLMWPFGLQKWRISRALPPRENCLFPSCVPLISSGDFSRLVARGKKGAPPVVLSPLLRQLPGPSGLHSLHSMGFHELLFVAGGWLGLRVCDVVWRTSGESIESLPRRLPCWRGPGSPIGLSLALWHGFALAQYHSEISGLG